MISLELIPVGSGLNRPESVLALADGRVFACDANRGVVRVLPTPSATADLSFPHADFLPNGIALLRDGTFLVANLGASGGLWRLVEAGKLIPFDLSAGVFPQSPLGFVFPDAQGRTWVVLTTSSSPRQKAFSAKVADGAIGVVDRKGRFKVCATGLAFANEARVDPGGRWLYVTETFARRLTRFEIGPDETLTNRETVTTFGAAVWPDGFEFDVEGNVWVTSVVSNRVIKVTPDGFASNVVDESDPVRMSVAEDNYRNDRYGPDEVAIGAEGILGNVSSIAFGGVDRRTAFLGNLSHARLTSWQSPVQGIQPLHWHVGATVLDV